MWKTLRRKQNDGMGNSQEHFADAAQAGSAFFAQSEVLQIFLPASMRGQSLFDWLSCENGWAPDKA
jgi:hypothetical protein